MRLDLHVHTDHSDDSSNNVSEIIAILKAKGFAGAAIIDHNSVEGGNEALSLQPKDFIIIPGVEVSTMDGHILALNVTTPIKREMSVLETIEAVHHAGGIAVAAHPYRYWSGLGEKNIMGKPFDAIEVKNGRSDDQGNRKAMKLAKRTGTSMVGGSDSHEKDTLGSAYTIVPDECDTIDKVIQAILENRTTADGRDRGMERTVNYVIKSVSQWLGRGMKRM